jgi:hypothetical protein
MESAEKRFEKPKEVQVSYKTLEKMQEQIGFAMARLGYGGGERKALDQVYGTLRDLLYFDRCPHAERSTRLVSISLDTLEKIERWVGSDGDTRFARESVQMEEVRRTIQKILFKAQFPRAE